MKLIGHIKPTTQNPVVEIHPTHIRNPEILRSIFSTDSCLQSDDGVSTSNNLAGTTDFTIIYKTGGFKLTAISDLNWGNNPDNCKLTSCYIMMLSRAPVSFKSGVQILTAMSTMEVDLVASALGMNDAVFCSNMLTKLGFGNECEQVPLHIDNTATPHARNRQPCI